MWGLLDKRTVSVLFTGLLFAAVGAFIYGAHAVLIAFLFAIFFAFLLDPWVSRMQLWTRVSRGSRRIAILEVYAILAVILAVLLMLVGPRIMDEGRRLGEALPVLTQKISSGEIARQIGAKRGWSYITQIRLEHFLAEHRSTVLAWATDFGAHAAKFAQNAIWLLLIPILAIFFLSDGRKFADEVVQMLERRQQRQFLRGLIDDLNEMLAHFIRAQLVLAGLSLIVYMGVLWLLRVPYAFVLGTIAGMMEFVPVVGPLVAAIVILGVAFLANYHHLMVLAIFLGGWRVMQDYISAPRIMGAKLKMHPLTAIFAVLVGGELGGVIGVYLSIPVMAGLRILWRRWQRYSGVRFAEPRKLGAA
jgi:predicted PurR-regulated permease PerM